jgi:hypothetical protein
VVAGDFPLERGLGGVRFAAVTKLGADRGRSANTMTGLLPVS